MSDPYVGWTRTKKQVISDINLEGKPIAYEFDEDVCLQFLGWAIRLCDDGTWFLEDTSGG